MITIQTVQAPIRPLRNAFATHAPILFHRNKEIPTWSINTGIWQVHTNHDIETEDLDINRADAHIKRSTQPAGASAAALKKSVHSNNGEGRLRSLPEKSPNQ